MPSGFTPVVIDLRPSVKVTIPWDKPSGVRFVNECVVTLVVRLRYRPF